MKSYNKYIVLFLFFIPLISWSQKLELKKAEAEYKKEEYYKALEYYNAAKELGEKFDEETQKKVGRCYYHLNNIDKAFEIFTELSDKLTGPDVLFYAISAHKIGGYDMAIELYEQAKKEGANPVQVNEMIKSAKWASENLTFLPNVVANPSTISTFGQSFGIAYYEDGVVYSSAVEGSKNVDKQGRSFLNLYYSDIENGQIQPSKKIFSDRLVFPYHVGAPAFTSDYKVLFFTRAVRVKGGRDVMKIYSVKNDGKEWGNVVELYINSDEFDCAYPAISPDNKLLYFVSNKRGGIGGKDIYVVELKGNNTFGEAKNLGKDINTYGDEVYPVVSKDNVLYFSSDGHYGFGGWDIFRADNINGQWTNVRNMMQPYNSTSDDFGYIIDPANSEMGFLSSNRTGERVDDVIFYVRPLDVEKVEEEKRPIAGMENLKKPVEAPVVPVTAEVKPAETTPAQASTLPTSIASLLKSTYNNEVIAGATIILKDPATGAIVGQAFSGADGTFNIPLPEGYQKADQEFELEISKGTDFKPKKMVVNINEFADLKRNGIALTPVFNDAVLDDISNMVIYYVGNEITADGYKVLEKLASYMQLHPDIVIKLNGHTEARGNRYENLEAGQRASEKCEKYLIEKGITDDNMIPRSYAERYLVNKCKRGVYCDNSTHLLNRRVEVIVWRNSKK